MKLYKSETIPKLNREEEEEEEEDPGGGCQRTFVAAS